jgi:putative flippase GtrA
MPDAPTFARGARWEETRIRRIPDQGDTTMPSLRGNTVRAAKFAAVGVVGVGVNTASLYALRVWEGMPLIPATVLAVELAVLSNYLLNSRWTFAGQAGSLRRLLRFNVSSLGALAVNIVCVWLLVRAGIYFLVADLVGIAAGFAVNFSLSVAWVWGRRA